MTSVYWIAHKDHTDMFSQGYIGISDRVNRRFWEHKTSPQNAHFKNAIEKYGWDNLVKKVVLVADKEYCLNIEKQLRHDIKIGWNLTIGGGNPPSFAGKKRSPEFIEKARLRVDSPETRLKKSLAAIGNKRNLGKKLSEETRAKIGAKHKGHKYLVGRQNGLKYKYIGTNIETGEQIQVSGNKEIKNAGFHTGHINDCAMGKQKAHKGYTWIKESIK